LDPQVYAVWNRGVLRRTLLAPARSRFQTLFSVSVLAALFAAPAILVSVAAIREDEKRSSDPWPSAQALKPDDFAREISDQSGPSSTVICVGFHTLFAGGHIRESGHLLRLLSIRQVSKHTSRVHGFEQHGIQEVAGPRSSHKFRHRLGRQGLSHSKRDVARFSRGPFEFD
jgi:hypothetical protein